jgi:hypothetical protein
MAPMRFVFALSCLLSFLWGCQSTSESFVYVPPERPSVTYRAPNQSSDELRPSTNFHNNGDSERFPERAYFGIQAADCIGPKGSRGVYIIKLSPDSVLRKIGMGTGDQVLSLGAHTPKSTSELTYVIQRLTPNTLQPIAYLRAGRRIEAVVVPPAWIPKQTEKQRIDRSYSSEQRTCSLIGLQNLR